MEGKDPRSRGGMSGETRRSKAQVEGLVLQITVRNLSGQEGSQCNSVGLKSSAVTSLCCRKNCGGKTGIPTPAGGGVDPGVNRGSAEIKACPEGHSI